MLCTEAMEPLLFVQFPVRGSCRLQSHPKKIIECDKYYEQKATKGAMKTCHAMWTNKHISNDKRQENILNKAA